MNYIFCHNHVRLWSACINIERKTFIFSRLDYDLQAVKRVMPPDTAVCVCLLLDWYCFTAAFTLSARAHACTRPHAREPTHAWPSETYPCFTVDFAAPAACEERIKMHPPSCDL